MGRRLKVLGIGLLLGMLFALWVAGPLVPFGMGLRHRAFVWATVMGGPVLFTVWDVAVYYMPIGLGWLGLLLVPAHPVHPHWATGIVTAAGLLLWFFAGFVTALVIHS